MSLSRKFKVSGFTLTELLVTVALLALFAAFVAPSFVNFLARQRVENSARSLVNLFSFSRAEAIRLNQPIDVCPLGVKSGNLETNGCSDSWASGALAYKAATDGYESGNDVRRVLIDTGKVGLTSSEIEISFSPEGTYDGATSARFILKSESDDEICSIVDLDLSGRAKICREPLDSSSEVSCSCS